MLAAISQLRADEIGHEQSRPAHDPGAPKGRDCASRIRTLRGRVPSAGCLRGAGYQLSRGGAGGAAVLADALAW
jgi:hypothetical protein